MSVEESRRKIWYIDSKGLIYEGRQGLNEEKSKYAHKLTFDAPENKLLEIIKTIKPNVLIGVSA